MNEYRGPDNVAEELEETVIPDFEVEALARVCCLKYRHTLKASRDKRPLKNGNNSIAIHKKRPLSVVADKGPFLVMWLNQL